MSNTTKGQNLKIAEILGEKDVCTLNQNKDGQIATKYEGIIVNGQGIGRQDRQFWGCDEESTEINLLEKITGLRMFDMVHA